MNYIFSHYQKLLQWGHFLATDNAVRKSQTEDKTECVEIITAGEVLVDDGSGTKKHYGRGAVFWHCAGDRTIYRAVPENPYHCIYFIFAVKENKRIFSRFNISWSQTPELSKFLHDMLNLKNTPDCDADALTAYCIGVLVRQAALTADEKDSGLPDSLNKICAAVDAEPWKNFSVNALAHKANISASRLFALFKKHFNISPHQWLTERKISMAAELLVSRPDMPVKEICKNCGFDTLEIFYRRFRRQFGMPPGKFREMKTINDQ